MRIGKKPQPPTPIYKPPQNLYLKTQDSVVPTKVDKQANAEKFMEWIHESRKQVGVLSSDLVNPPESSSISVHVSGKKSPTAALSMASDPRSLAPDPLYLTADRKMTPEEIPVEYRKTFNDRKSSRDESVVHKLSIELGEIAHVDKAQLGDTIRPGYPMHNRTNRNQIGNDPKSINRFWNSPAVIASAVEASPLESKLKQLLAQDHAAAGSPARFVAKYKPTEGPDGGSLKQKEFKALADGAPMPAPSQGGMKLSLPGGHHGIFVFGDGGKDVPEKQDFANALERYTTKGQLTYFQGKGDQLYFVHPDAAYEGHALIGQNCITPIIVTPASERIG